MQKDVISDILASIEGFESVGKGISLCFGDLGETVFSDENFRSLSPEIYDLNMAFIDGGNAEIFSSSGLVVHFVRIFHSIYRGSKRVSCGSDDFYIVAKAKNIGGSLRYCANIFRSRQGVLDDSFFGRVFDFDPFDDFLSKGKMRFGLSDIPGILRRIAEISVAKGMLNKCVCAVVLDGDLVARNELESEYIKSLLLSAGSSGVLLCSIAKTNNLLDSNCNPVSVSLNSLSPYCCWYYSLKVQDISVLFAKLHSNSDYVFKIDLFSEKKLKDLSEFLSILAYFSKDPVFLGYPYPLVEADRMARVSNAEKSNLAALFFAKSGKLKRFLDLSSGSLNAHSILDNIS